MSRALTEVGQHTAREAWIVQRHGQGVHEIDVAAHHLGRLTARQVQQELRTLQMAPDDSELGRLLAWAALPDEFDEILRGPSALDGVSPHIRIPHYRDRDSRLSCLHHA
ncbi:hypothetical protein [Streptomyces chattanoogensis]|uniref:hypothetical protein n=1 Tax=Streptomyces chattanoogensis TaxID=66876 RepID=UPI0012FEBF9B|nr:hypothetical protein [Streptomyces chattanoogensis]